MYHCVFEMFNPFRNKPWFICVSSTSLWKTVGWGEIARNKQLLLFPQCFLISVQNCLLASSGTGSFGFFVGVSLCKTLQHPSLAVMKPRNDMSKVSCCRDITEIPDDKILDVTELKTFADNKFIVSKVMNSLFDKVENNGKRNIGTKNKNFINLLL